MLKRKTASRTPEYPTSKEVFAALLEQLIQENMDSAWAHFEIVTQGEGGRFREFLFDNAPWVEVALVDQGRLQLNLGPIKAKDLPLSAVPDKWRQESKGLWTVPVADLRDLVEWMDGYLAFVSGNIAYQVEGWLDG